MLRALQQFKMVRACVRACVCVCCVCVCVCARARACVCVCVPAKNVSTFSVEKTLSEDSPIPNTKQALLATFPE